MGLLRWIRRSSFSPTSSIDIPRNVAGSHGWRAGRQASMIPTFAASWLRLRERGLANCSAGSLIGRVRTRRTL